MKRSFFIQQKMKVAGLLFGIMLVIVITSMHLERCIRAMNQTLTSVYADRLQPTVGLVYLSEYVYAKRLLLETALAGQTTPPTPALTARLHHLDAVSKHQIDQFEKTNLTPDEANRLRAFKTGMANYARLEERVMQLNLSGQPKAATLLFYEQGGVVFRQVILDLHELAQIQLRTAQEAVKHVHREAAGGSINATLLIAISIVIGLLINGFIFNAKPIKPETPYFHLN